MSVNLVIDNNERGYIKDYYTTKEIEFRTLTLGDILIEHVTEQGETIPLILIERKTIEDLANSIRTKRHKNQKIRLLQMRNENPNLHIWYLIENFEISNENKQNKIDSITHDALLSSIVNTLVRDKLNVIMLNNTEETCLFIDKLYEKVKNEFLGQMINVDGGSRVEYIDTIKLKKKDNITPTICYQLQLSQIPGVSSKIAKKIQEYYPNMLSLCQSYINIDNIKDKERMLTTIKGIGKILSKRIYDYVKVN